MRTSAEERPGTPRAGACDMDLAAFAFDLELEEAAESPASLQAEDALCTLHACWTMAEAHEAYHRETWLCGVAARDEEACESRAVPPSPDRRALPEPVSVHRAARIRTDDVSPACIDMSLFWCAEESLAGYKGNASAAPQSSQDVLQTTR